MILIIIFGVISAISIIGLVILSVINTKNIFEREFAKISFAVIAVVISLLFIVMLFEYINCAEEVKSINKRYHVNFTAEDMFWNKKSIKSSIYTIKLLDEKD